jgi:hypothetical protein
MATKYPYDKAYSRVKADLKAGQELTFAHIGEVFGPEFWYLIVEALMDSQDAARAIHGAISRLKAGDEPTAEETDGTDAEV